MSAIALIDRPARPGNLFAALAAFRAGEPRLFDLGVLMLAAMAPTAFAALVDQREFLGINVWDKPLKFEFALAVYLLTLVLFARLLPAGTRRMRWYRTYVTAVIGAIVLEIAWVGGAAALGTASHFNTTTAGMVLYSIMGPLAVLLTSITAVYAWQIARNPATGLSPAVKEGVVLGLALTLPLTLVTAGTMASMGGHWVGGGTSDAGGLALMGWSRDGGDLRIAHFFATHAMHAIPAFALVSASLLGRDDRRPARIFAVLFTAFVAYTFVEALLGRPFLPFLG
ncbi:hypothetical protein [Mesorhizobium sp. J428]|uniref:hypothetical protein n=1 Tax=Mesorhizobium sp. J428 TaxID=2898440 RepID=UPI002150CAB4|nr:hypothetical protein [Mesorhizobium sp. J428]MCR5855915.1 hypothetical protein [Mesorhizobium sp. J428]